MKKEKDFEAYLERKQKLQEKQKKEFGSLLKKGLAIWAIGLIVGLGGLIGFIALVVYIVKLIWNG